jgi:hypothetical protein
VADERGAGLTVVRPRKPQAGVNLRVVVRNGLEHEVISIPVGQRHWYAGSTQLSPSAAALLEGCARSEPESGGDLLSEVRTPVDRSTAEALDWERDRVAWNLPPDPNVAPARPMRETPTESRELHESAEQAAENG